MLLIANVESRSESGRHFKTASYISSPQCSKLIVSYFLKCTYLVTCIIMSEGCPYFITILCTTFCIALLVLNSLWKMESNTHNLSVDIEQSFLTNECASYVMAIIPRLLASNQSVDLHYQSKIPS